MGGKRSDGFMKKPRAPRETSKLSEDPETTTKYLSVVICILGKLGTFLKSRDDVARLINTAWYLLEVLIWGVRVRDIPS
jgi:hypothetical protein